MPLEPSFAADLACVRIVHDALVVEVKLLRLRLWLDRARQSELKTANDRAFARCRAALRRYAETCSKANYNENQPRVPAGNSDGGQWTDEDWGGEVGSSESTQPLVTSDLPTTGIPAAQYAQTGPRGPRPTGAVLVSGEWVTLTPAQAARLAVADSRASDTATRVRELDPSWQPRPSMYATVDGLITSREAEAREAEARLAELGRAGIGPGLYAVEWIPARGPERNFTSAERAEINRIGNRWGCHTCGASTPGTMSGNWVCDHQTPTAMNLFGRGQRLYPQCWKCSSEQGLWIIRYWWRR